MQRLVTLIKQDLNVETVWVEEQLGLRVKMKHFNQKL